ncbi:MAG: hypothetical protein ACFFCW_00015 [Candidatus Hodarchaeota archaeon]
MKRRIYSYTSCNYAALLIAFLLAAYVSGCTSVSTDPRPFEKYRDAFSEVQSAADTVLTVDYKWTYERFLQRAREGDPSAIQNLILAFPEENYYLWNLPSEELFIKVKRTQEAFKSLNAAFAAYTSLLAQLASGSLVDVKTFDGLAKELNDNSLSASRALKLEAPEKAVAIFSIAATEAARLYIEKKRRDYLINIITENQKGVDLFAEQATNLVRLVAIDIKAEYNNQIKPLVGRWGRATGDSRVKVLEELIELNSEITTLLETLRSLEQSYTVFARKHRELGEVLSSDTVSSFQILDLINIGRRLSNLYKELTQEQAE